MKKQTMLPLAALVSAVLAGCGGGSGGSGGSDSSSSGGGSSTSNVYTFELVQATFEDSPGNCQVYDRVVESGETTSYMVVDSVSSTSTINNRLFVEFSDADGIPDSSTQTYASSGKLSFDLEDVPDGGYVNIVEFSGSRYYITSYSKDFLEQDNQLKNSLINIQSEISDFSCNTGSDVSQTTTSPSVSITSDSDYLLEDSISPAYYFTSSIDEDNSTSPNNGNTEINILSDDTAVITQYRDTEQQELVQYGFEDYDELTYTSELSDIDRTTVSNDYDELIVGIEYNGTYKSLVELDSTSDSFYHPSSPGNSENWFFYGETDFDSNSWAVSYNLPLDPDTDGWDVLLNEASLYEYVNDTSLTDTDESLSIDSNNILTYTPTNLNDDISANLVQRVSVAPTTDLRIALQTVYTLSTELDVIFPMISKNTIFDDNGDDEVTVADEGTLSFQQTYWMTENEGDLDSRYIVDKHVDVAASGTLYDAPGIIIEESTRHELEAESYTVNYLALEH